MSYQYWPEMLHFWNIRISKIRWHVYTGGTYKPGFTVESITAQTFQLYSYLLTEETRRPRCKILGEQIDGTPWHDLFIVEHTDEHYRSWRSFMDCVTFHLLLVFRSDASETQQFYISNSFNKPNRVAIRQFVRRVQQLNGYWTYCPASPTLSRGGTIWWHRLSKSHLKNGPKSLARSVQAHGEYCTTECLQATQSPWVCQKGLLNQEGTWRA